MRQHDVEELIFEQRPGRPAGLDGEQPDPDVFLIVSAPSRIIGSNLGMLPLVRRSTAAAVALGLRLLAVMLLAHRLQIGRIDVGAILGSGADVVDVGRRLTADHAVWVIAEMPSPDSSPHS